MTKRDLIQDLLHDVLLDVRDPEQKEKLKVRVRKFIEYHAENKDVWEAFEKGAIKLYKSGVGRYGAMALIQAIRFHVSIKRKSEFKINNNYVAFYSRMFEIKYPQCRGFFEQRKLKVKTKEVNNG